MCNKDFKYAKLSENQVNFLKEYAPKSRHFTSTLEIKQVASKLGLDKTSDIKVLRSIRNSVIRLYSKLSKEAANYNENGEFVSWTDKSMDLNNSIQSVTAIIDHFIKKELSSIIAILDESFPFYDNSGSSWELADENEDGLCLHGTARSHYYKVNIQGKYYYSLRNGMRGGLYFYLSREDALEDKECTKEDIINDVIA